METITGRYQLNYYELDLPIASNYRSRWPAIEDDGCIIINTNSEDSLLFDCVVQSISHPMLGNIQGMFPVGLDYTVVFEDFSQLQLEAEETPGMLYRDNCILAPGFFEVQLWNSKFTEIPYKYAYSGLTRNESKLMWEERYRHVRQKLQISK